MLKPKIYLAFDFDYESDYDNLPNIYEAIGNTPVTFFLSETRHPKDKVFTFPSNVDRPGLPHKRYADERSLD
jgi:hypothetical protein